MRVQCTPCLFVCVRVCVCVCVRVRVRVRVCFFKPNVNACPRDQGCTLRDQVNNFLTYC